MTICISVKVSEGLVLAADSMATANGIFTEPNGQTSRGVLKTYDNARKLSHIKDYPIGTLSWGSFLVGPRSVESLIKEYEYCLPSLQDEQEKSRQKRMRGEEENSSTSYKYNVKTVAQNMMDHIKRHYDSNFADTPKEQIPQLGVLVSGYSSDQFFPEQWLIDLPNGNEVIQRRPDIDGRPSFGADWFGLTDAMIRFYWGRDEDVIGIISEKFGLDQQAVAEALSDLQYPILFDGMPLQDAIDFAVFVVNLVIGRFRFVVGAPLCGGDIDVAVITPNRFTWVRRKTWTAKL